jgi:hypothetical protein
MATIIEQRPLYSILPVGQDLIFTVSNNTIVATELNVKFIAEVHISSTFAPNLSTNNDVIGTFKTTPNNAGVGIFDLRSVIENYVNADNTTTSNSEYKTTTPSAALDLPIHLIDKFSGNNNAMKYLAIQFKIEYLGATNCAGDQDDNIVRTACGEAVNSIDYRIFNGYLKRTDELQLVGNNFGYDIGPYELTATATDSFLSNAPTTQYANIEDYGTMAFIDTNGNVSQIFFTYYDSSGSSLGTDIVYRSTANGAYDVYDANIRRDLLHFGCFPANLTGANLTTWVANSADVSYYTVVARTGVSELSHTVTINVNCPDLKGYVPIRLAWLNQWGAWDYYTFTKKSSRSISTQGSTYSQQGGTWNEGIFKLNGYKGGQKSFRVNATERIKMNTDFVSEADGQWFEELINSPEIYMLEGYQTDVSDPLLNQYVTPVRLTTSSYTRKTIANDKLMQYTFEIEKANILRTQAI